MIHLFGQTLLTKNIRLPKSILFISNCLLHSMWFIVWIFREIFVRRIIGKKLFFTALVNLNTVFGKFFNWSFFEFLINDSTKKKDENSAKIGILNTNDTCKIEYYIQCIGFKRLVYVVTWNKAISDKSSILEWIFYAKLSNHFVE